MVHSFLIYFQYNSLFDLTFIKQKRMQIHAYDDVPEFIAQLFTIIALITCVSGWERETFDFSLQQLVVLEHKLVIHNRYHHHHH